MRSRKCLPVLEGGELACQTDAQEEASEENRL
jgi:hypothetical protein